MRAAVAGCRGIAPTGLTALRMLERKKEGKKKRKRDKEEQAWRSVDTGPRSSLAPWIGSEIWVLG